MILQIRVCLLFVVGWLIALSLSSIVSAKSLSPAGENRRGFELLERGAASEAIAVWKTAQQLYEQAGDEEGVLGTQINQALAQQALGLYPLSCETLTQALDITSGLCPTRNAAPPPVDINLSSIQIAPVSIVGLRLLGESLSRTGQLLDAAAVLTFAQDNVSQSSLEKDRLAVAMGNVHATQVKKALQDYERLGYGNFLAREDKLARIEEETKQAVAQYRLANEFTNTELAVKANINSIELLSTLLNKNIQSTDKGKLVLELVSPAAEQAYNEISASGFNFDQLPVIESIYARLSLARSLLKIRSNSSSDGSWGSVPDNRIGTLVKKAVEDSTQINNNRALSFSYGTAGDFQQAAGNGSSLAELYEKALSFSQVAQAPDASYQWAYKLALLSEDAGDMAQAQKYYKTAIASLASVRDDLISVNSEIRFGFREQVEPVYRDYIRLLISHKDEAHLREAIKTHDSLQLAQIENYLRCGRLAPVAKAPLLATVHIINLDSTVEVVVSSQNQSRAYSVPSSDVLLAAEGLVSNIQSDTFFTLPEDNFLPYAQLLYDKLLRPAVEAGWLTEDVELSFVLDAPFQSIPMAILHDGQQYLIEKHPLSNALQVNQRQPRIQGADKALFAGISELAPSFSGMTSFGSFGELEETEVERKYLSTYASSTKSLLNGEFTAEALRKEITRGDFSIVHVSTHGQFGSVPEQTFLLAWDEPIDFLEIRELFQTAQGMDLLFLSACESAAGDERATLGLAGIAIQSSAKNAIATLWAEDSAGGSVLVSLFYEALVQENVSIAEALQQAQKLLLTSDAFSHPYYWASFILVAS